MNKKIILTGIIVLLFSNILSGCLGGEGNSEDNPKVINLNDSITYGNIRLTFLSATWRKPYEWVDSYYYYLKIEGENIGSAKDSVFVVITKYEMANGYTYSNDYIWQYFSLNPGRNSTLEISSFIGNSQIIDRDFLPVAKIYIKLDTVANPLLAEKNPYFININV